MKLPTLVATALLLAATAQAQTVWRCGPDGRSYSDSPCPEGRTVAVADARSSADVAAAQAVVSRERLLAAQMARQRQQREQVAPGAGLAGIRHTLPEPVKVKVLAPRKPKHRLEAPGTWRAVAPVTPRNPG